MTVRKIVKRQQSLGPLLYNLYFTVPTIHPKDMKHKESIITGPTVCVTAKHYIPTTDGYKIIEDIKIGDSVLYSLELITK